MVLVLVLALILVLVLVLRLHEDCVDPINFSPLVALPGVAGWFARKRAALRESLTKELCSAFPGLAADRAVMAVHATDTRTLFWRKTQVRALVPFFDFMNHSERPNAVWSMDDDGAVRVEAMILLLLLLLLLLLMIIMILMMI